MKVWDYKSGSEDKLATQLNKDKDIVMTTPLMAKHLVSLINFNDGDIVVDPCVGKGAFYNELPKNVTREWFEINSGKDYLNSELLCDITLSNPPFVPRKLFWEFHKKAMATTNREIWWLINFHSLNVFTQKRLDFMLDSNWFINRMHVVSDKRWYGRYAWVQFTHDRSSLITWNSVSF